MKPVQMLFPDTKVQLVYVTNGEGLANGMVLVIANVTASSATISLWLVPDGGQTPADINALLDERPIAAHQTEVIELPGDMSEAGMTIMGQVGTGNAIALTLLGRR